MKQFNMFAKGTAKQTNYNLGIPKLIKYNNLYMCDVWIFLREDGYWDNTKVYWDSKILKKSKKSIETKTSVLKLYGI